MAKKPLTAQERNEKSYEIGDFTSLNKLYRFVFSLDGLSEVEKAKLYESLRTDWQEKIAKDFSDEAAATLNLVRRNYSYYSSAATSKAYEAIAELCEGYKMKYNPNFEYNFSSYTRKFVIKIGSMVIETSIEIR